MWCGDVFKAILLASTRTYYVRSQIIVLNFLFSISRKKSHYTLPPKMLMIVSSLKSIEGVGALNREGLNSNRQLWNHSAPTLRLLYSLILFIE